MFRAEQFTCQANRGSHVAPQSKTALEQISLLESAGVFTGTHARSQFVFANSPRYWKHLMSDSFSISNAASPDVDRGAVQASREGPSGASDAPPGWDYNPSAWSRRIPLLVIALLNGGIAIYLALYELRVIGSVWDPFFGNGSMRVLDSPVSRAFPVPDALLGAVVYLLEAASIGFGDTQRWKTKPWVCLSFALLTAPLWLTGLVLVVLQPSIVHAWCTLCLVTAAGVFLLAPLAVDEALAAAQFVLRGEIPARHRRGGDENYEPRSPWDRLLRGAPRDETTARTTRLFQGFSLPWSLAACAALGLWLFLSPFALGTRGDAAVNDFACGAFILACALLAGARAARPVRFACAACGVWLLIIAPWTLTYTASLTRPNEVLTGVAVMVLSAIPLGGRT
jgi:hypothetical protein